MQNRYSGPAYDQWEVSRLAEYTRSRRRGVAGDRALEQVSVRFRRCSMIMYWLHDEPALSEGALRTIGISCVPSDHSTAYAR